MKNSEHNNKTMGSSLKLESNSITESEPNVIRQLILVASIACGVQFGWAIQLSLLTPYVQLLGISHTWAPYIWLCGPISGMIVQPTVGYYSDRTTSRFGRRRPFIAVGAALITVAAFLIGFAADIGRAAGDPLEKNKPKSRAITVFVVGFWILDVANNTLQGPCRAFLADLSAGSQSLTRTSNAFFSFFMAVGNVLGYAAGSYGYLYKFFSFSHTKACDVYCANLKSCFIISVALLLFFTTLALTLVKERSYTREELVEEEEEKEQTGGGCAKLPFFGQLVGALKDLPRPMWILLLVTGLNWIALFPFFLFDTDWMGKEVYGGEPGNGKSYELGVHAGTLGLMINAIILGIASLGVEGMARILGGVNKLWGGVNFILAASMLFMVLVTKLAAKSRHDIIAKGGVPPSTPPMGITSGALAIFAILGIPLAVTFSIPFALASIFSTSSGSGQGLSLGVLNLSIVIPQIIVSVTSGPWDQLFGGGNLPAFVVGAIAAVISGVLALILLPSPSSDTKIDGFMTDDH